MLLSPCLQNAAQNEPVPPKRPRSSARNKKQHRQKKNASVSVSQIYEEFERELFEGPSSPSQSPSSPPSPPPSEPSSSSSPPSPSLLRQHSSLSAGRVLLKGYIGAEYECGAHGHRFIANVEDCWNMFSVMESDSAHTENGEKKNEENEEKKSNDKKIDGKKVEIETALNNSNNMSNAFCNTRETPSRSLQSRFFVDCYACKEKANRETSKQKKEKKNKGQKETTSSCSSSFASKAKLSRVFFVLLPSSSLSSSSRSTSLSSSLSCRRNTDIMLSICPSVEWVQSSMDDSSSSSSATSSSGKNRCCGVLSPVSLPADSFYVLRFPYVSFFWVPFLHRITMIFLLTVFMLQAISFLLLLCSVHTLLTTSSCF